ncbi:MAG: hypothetical protein WEA58_11480 [Balneolaceae bacterium]
MSTLQPISTLRDHNNVLRLRTPESLRNRRRLPGIIEEDPEPELESSRENVIRSIEDQKVSLDNLLMPDPERPERDNEMIGKNRNLAKKAALIQVIDSIGEAVNLSRNQENAVVAPTRYGDLGLSALDNMRNMDQEHKVDLNRYNRRKEDVDQQNRQAVEQAVKINTALDTNAAKFRFDSLKDELNRANEDDDAMVRRHHQAALRYLSAGDLETAEKHLRQAGLIAPPQEDDQPQEEVNSSTSPPPDQSADQPAKRSETEEKSNTSDLSDEEVQKRAQEVSRSFIQLLENSLVTAENPEKIDTILDVHKKINRQQMLRIGVPEGSVDKLNQEVLQESITDRLLENEKPEDRRNIFAAWEKLSNDLLGEENVPPEERGEEIRKRFRDLIKDKTTSLIRSNQAHNSDLIWELMEIADSRGVDRRTGLTDDNTINILFERWGGEPSSNEDRNENPDSLDPEEESAEQEERNNKSLNLNRNTRLEIQEMKSN